MASVMYHTLSGLEDGRLSVRLPELGSEKWKISWHSRMLDRCKNYIR